MLGENRPPHPDSGQSMTPQGTTSAPMARKGQNAVISNVGWQVWGLVRWTSKKIGLPGPSTGPVLDTRIPGSWGFVGWLRARYQTITALASILASARSGLPH